MKRQVLIDDDRPDGLEVFVSGQQTDKGYQTATSHPTQAPPPAPRLPSGGSAVSVPKTS